MKRCVLFLTLAWGMLLTALSAHAQVAGTPMKTGDLAIVKDGKSQAVIYYTPGLDQKSWEYRAAADLAKYIEMITGAKLTPADTNTKFNLAKDTPIFYIGSAALKAKPDLQKSLDKVAKKNPTLRADAIVLRRDGNTVYLAGMNDECHYYATAELLKQWGCRWFMQTDFGECIPTYTSLSIGKLDYAYAPPFEIRGYWLSWIGDYTGRDEFMHRNGMNNVGVPCGHNMVGYVQDIVPAGKSAFNVPIAEEATAKHVADQAAADFAAGKDIMLGMDDGIYKSDSPVDAALKGNLFDKYMYSDTLTDNFMVFYNNVARFLLEKAPNSKAHIGFLAYSNMTIPPQRNIVAEKPLVAYLAPIDIDPIHGMDDPKSLPEREYKEMMYRWSEVMQGRLAIYDYDQGMLVWRDIPDPSIAHVKQNMKHYRNAGILGVNTESRGAVASIFNNLYIRGQLMWNPDADMDALLVDFYRKFYGPAEKPMADYWNSINKAWEDSIITEHEYFVAPAIYTPELLARLRKDLEEAEAIVLPLRVNKIVLTRSQGQYLERMKFTRLGFEVLNNYMAMVHAAATDGDYAAAVAAGKKGLAAREELTKMNGTFTTTRLEGGYAWWPGEVQQYQELLPFTNGEKGKLIAKLPLEWAFRRDPLDTGIMSNWARKPVDLSWWKKQAGKGSIASHMNNPGEWETLRTDLYAQAQGVLYPNYNNYNGYAWYATEVKLNAAQIAGKPHLRFPGIFDECWLYVNGELVAHRDQQAMWWINDYRFEWDVDLTGKLKAGANNIFVRYFNPHHMGGIWRRAFLYSAL